MGFRKPKLFCLSFNSIHEARSAKQIKCLNFFNSHLPYWLKAEDVFKHKSILKVVRMGNGG